MAIREEAIEVLVQKAASLFGKDPASLGAGTRFIEDLEAKSVNFVQLSAALEEQFEVEVPYMEFRKKSTFGEAADFIAKIFGE
jgi:acyl carrier protein